MTGYIESRCVVLAGAVKKLRLRRRIKRAWLVFRSDAVIFEDRDVLIKFLGQFYPSVSGSGFGQVNEMRCSYCLKTTKLPCKPEITVEELHNEKCITMPLLRLHRQLAGGCSGEVGS